MRRIVTCSLVLTAAAVAAPAAAQSSFTAARRAGGTTAVYSTGPMAYEIEITNSRNNALRTELLVHHAPTAAGGQKTLKARVPVDVPANSKRWFPFTQQTGLVYGACHQETYWLTLADGSAPARTMQVRPHCGFEFKVAGGSDPSPTGKVSASVMPVAKFHCTEGFRTELQIVNGTSALQTISYQLIPPRPGGGYVDAVDVKVSPQVTLVPRAKGYLRAGVFLPQLHHATGDGQLSGWRFNIQGASATLTASPATTWRLERSCVPQVGLQDGEVAWPIGNWTQVWSPPNPNGIQVVNALYGRNCGLNPGGTGDITTAARAKCNDRTSCSFQVSWALWGGKDPSPSLCTKEIEIKYTCGWFKPVKTVRVFHRTPEQSVPLACP
jgi:hypothetical protein